MRTPAPDGSSSIRTIASPFVVVPVAANHFFTLSGARSVPLFRSRVSDASWATSIPADIASRNCCSGMEGSSDTGATVGDVTENSVAPSSGLATAFFWTFSGLRSSTRRRQTPDRLDRIVHGQVPMDVPASVLVLLLASGFRGRARAGCVAPPTGLADVEHLRSRAQSPRPSSFGVMETGLEKRSRPGPVSSGVQGVWGRPDMRGVVSSWCR